jgi:hypothetical protein
MKSYRIFTRKKHETDEDWKLINYTTLLDSALQAYVNACLEHGRDNVCFCQVHDVKLSVCSLDTRDGALQNYIVITPSVVYEDDKGD